MPDVDPRDRALVAVGRGRKAAGTGASASASSDGGIGRRRRDHELGLAAPKPELDRAGCELDRDLLGGRRQRVLQRQPDRRIQRRGEPRRRARAPPHPRPAAVIVELAVDVLDVRVQFHGSTYGTMMVPCQPLGGAFMRQAEAFGSSSSSRLRFRCGRLGDHLRARHSGRHPRARDRDVRLGVVLEPLGSRG